MLKNYWQPISKKTINGFYLFLKKIKNYPMNLIKISSLAIITLAVAAACHSSKKSTTSSSTASSAPTATSAPSTVAADPVAPAKSTNGIYAPGNGELTAAQAKYPDATLQVLSDGYAVYTGTACTGCHSPKNIYKRSLEKWPHIIDDMGKKASLTAVQKDALTKYVFAIKATQPAEAK
jgi:type IV secretory pathway VirB6-like protein